jgi:glyoxylase-like metal-dependent hydrolase (beta-lactamase superfamily II)
MQSHIKIFINPNIFSSNVYVISYDNTVIVIDPWFYDWELKEYLEKLWKVDVILLTHGHWDHIRCVDKMVEDYPKAKVFIHPFDKELLSNIQLNCSFLVWNEEIKVESDVTLIEQWNYNFWELSANVIHVPWHTDGCVMYYFEKLSALFLGDTVMSDSIWTLSTPTWDINKMQASLWKFKHLWIDMWTLCYPGHWEEMCYWEILRINLFLKWNF